jgi:hypothetical protein
MAERRASLFCNDGDLPSPPTANAGGAPDVTLTWLAYRLGALANKRQRLCHEQNESVLQARESGAGSIGKP